jgi:hypothetical protein
MEKINSIKKYSQKNNKFKNNNSEKKIISKKKKLYHDDLILLKGGADSDINISTIEVVGQTILGILDLSFNITYTIVGGMISDITAMIVIFQVLVLFILIYYRGTDRVMIDDYYYLRDTTNNLLAQIDTTKREAHELIDNLRENINGIMYEISYNLDIRGLRRDIPSIVRYFFRRFFMNILEENIETRGGGGFNMKGGEGNIIEFDNKNIRFKLENAEDINKKYENYIDEISKEIGKEINKYKIYDKLEEKINKIILNTEIFKLQIKQPQNYVDTNEDVNKKFFNEIKVVYNKPINHTLLFYVSFAINISIILTISYYEKKNIVKNIPPQERGQFGKKNKKFFFLNTIINIIIDTPPNYKYIIKNIKEKKDEILTILEKQFNKINNQDSVLNILKRNIYKIGGLNQLDEINSEQKEINILGLNLDDLFILENNAFNKNFKIILGEVAEIINSDKIKTLILNQEEEDKLHDNMDLSFVIKKK